MAKVYIGTSGFMYDHWGGGVVYPKGVKKEKWLEAYTEKFSSVELNVTFYRLPSAEAFTGWYQRTPKGFVFALKGSRLITHLKKLKDCGEAVEEFGSRAGKLKGKLGVVLWQLPGNWRVNYERLEEFCKLVNDSEMGKGVRHAWEFRQESWMNERVDEILRRYQMAVVVADSSRWPRREVVTTDWVYLRFHGPRGLYNSSYTDEELEEWAGKCVYGYFNNDAQGWAVNNAQMLEALVGEN
jgi:uncharacterized protein YecE (DUF72 family)